jgi:prevent-host-death family protein
MEKTISASELKNSLGAVLREVRKDDETVVIEQRGVPAAAIISIEDLRVLREAKEEKRKQRLLEDFRSLRASLAERQKGMSPEEAERQAQEFADEIMEAVVAKARHRFEQTS